MKTSCFSLPICLRLALALTVFPFSVEKSQAENPLKFLRAKAKQGISKVAQAVNPRRVGTAIRNVKNATVDAAPSVRVRPAEQPGYLYETPPPPYHSQTPGRMVQRETTTHTYYPPGDQQRSIPGEIHPSSPDYRPSYLPQPLTPSPGLAPGETARGSTTRLDTERAAKPFREKFAERDPDPDESSLEVAGKPDGRKEASKGAPPKSLSKSSPKLEPSPSEPTAPLKKRPSLDELPFGESVPGKKGFVFSPYSKKELVDVSGIPAGTRVKCPYTSNVFRVP